MEKTKKKQKKQRRAEGEQGGQRLGQNRERARKKREIEGRRREIVAGKLTSEGKGDASVIKAEKRKGRRERGGLRQRKKAWQKQNKREIWKLEGELQQAATEKQRKES